MAAEHPDIPATLVFEFGDLRVCIGPADDARIMPWIELVCRNVVGYHNLVDRIVAPAIPILAYDQRAAELHARSRARLSAIGKTPPFADGPIAATAMANDLTLITLNRDDFVIFQGLQVDDWLTPGTHE